MATLRVLNSKGDTSVTWAPDKIDREGKAAVKEAERIFRESTQQGATAFRVESGKPAVRVDTFDPSLDVDMVIVPRIAGG